MLFSPITRKAPAKINLFLNLLGQRPDGFHEVRFIMQALDLADTLEITSQPNAAGLQFHCTHPALNTPNNLVVKAYHLFYAQTGLPPIPMRVVLTKEIPVQAGLGGGSSDATALLQALNDLHAKQVSLETLAHIAAQLGSDCPFFLKGGTCLATGRGEVILPLPSLPPLAVALIKPRHNGISTQSAFQWIREQNHYMPLPLPEIPQIDQQQSRLIWNLGKLLHNDFETVVFQHHPELRTAKALLKNKGISHVLLSGSGPTLFALLETPEMQWPVIVSLFPETDWEWFQTTFSVSPWGVS